MIESLRDRYIIAACLVLYALGMMMVTIGHSHTHENGVMAQSDIVSFGVDCAVDSDEQAPTHCPYCRLVDAAFDIAPSGFTPHLVTSFTLIVQVENHSVQTFDPQRSTPTRGPPLFV